MRIMNFKKWDSSIKESVKEDVMDQILDKIYNKSKLSEAEKRFLNNYNKSSNEEYKDFRLLTKNDTYLELLRIINGGRKVICDLHDRDGKISVEIVEVSDNDIDEESCKIKLKSGKVIELKDNHLYNIIYNSQKDEYSLESQDEYYEKIPISNED